MQKVYIVGAGQTPVTRRKGHTIAAMGGGAISAALKDASIEPASIGALYVGNMLSGILSQQQHLGVLLANAAGLTGIEAATIDACCGAGAAAMRMAWTAVAGGIHKSVVVTGVEQMTHLALEQTTAGTPQAADSNSTVPPVMMAKSLSNRSSPIWAAF